MNRVIASSILPEDIIKELSKLDIHCIQGFKNELIQNETAYHPDMLFYKLQNGNLLCSLETPFVHILDTFVNIIKTKEMPRDGYPQDCIFNCFTTSKALICGPNPSQSIIEDAVSASLDICKVRQGYCACSTIKLNDNAFISSDKGIVKALESYGHDVLFVTNEGIELNGYNNGFIGGCALCVDDKILLTGAIENHKNYNEIKKFSKKHGKDLISLNKRNLYDYGGFILL